MKMLMLFHTFKCSVHLNEEMRLHSLQGCVSGMNEREMERGGAGAKQQPIRFHITLLVLDHTDGCDIDIIKCYIHTDIWYTFGFIYIVLQF